MIRPFLFAVAFVVLGLSIAILDVLVRLAEATIKTVCLELNSSLELRTKGLLEAGDGISMSPDLATPRLRTVEVLRMLMLLLVVSW